MSRSSPSNCSGTCPHCAAKIPGWWVRDYCANCGEEIPQTAQQAEIARLKKAIEDIDDITGFDWPTMPEPIKENIHKQLREIVLTALARPNSEDHSQIVRFVSSFIAHGFVGISRGFDLMIEF